MTPEIHIASCVVRVRPEALAAAASMIDALPGAEVSARGTDRLVAVLEGQSTGDLLELVDAIQLIPAVYSVALAYQHAENATAMEESLS